MSFICLSLTGGEAMELILKLGERIRFLRRERNLSQEQLGELSNLHTNYIGAIERGEKNISLESLVKVSKGLSVSLDELFRYLEPMDKPDDLQKIVDLLSNRSSEDQSLALTLLVEIFHWEQKKNQ